MKCLNQPLNILVIDNSEYPLTYGYMQEIFGNCLANRGHNVTWLLMSADAVKSGESRKIGSTDVVLTPMVERNGSISIFLNYFYYKVLMTRELPSLIFNRNIDVVFVRNHVRAGFSTYRVCKRKNIPFIYYLGYPQLESYLVAARIGHRKPRIVAEASALIGIPLRNWITRKADFVFTMSDYWRNQIINELGISSKKVNSLPAGFNTSINPEKVDGSEVRKKFNLGDHPTLFYMGTISPPRDTSILVNMMAKVVHEIPEARLLLLYGNGEEKQVQLLRKEFANQGIENNTVFAPPVPYQQVPFYIAASHVGLSPIETIPLYNVSSPYKFTEMLGMGCPVIASNTPDQEYALRKSGGGIYVHYEASAFADAAIYLLTNAEEAKQMGRCGRVFVENERSYDVLADRIESVFYQLLHKRGESLSR